MFIMSHDQAMRKPSFALVFMQKEIRSKEPEGLRSKKILHDGSYVKEGFTDSVSALA